MTVDDACIYLRFVDAAERPQRRKFYAWRERNQVRCHRLGHGRLMRFRREDLDATLVAVDGPPIIHKVGA